MAEFVVYEDTPIAEYLKSIESNESIVKPAPLHLGIHATETKTTLSVMTQLSETIYRYWRHSFFHDTFAISLPIMEEVAFEEKFKYLIVTSPLLNDTQNTHSKQQRHNQPPPTPFHSAAAHTRSGRIGTIATLSGLFIALGVERFAPFQRNETNLVSTTTTTTTKHITPTVTMVLASGMSLFFIYRHLRRSSIRKLYQCALTQLQDVIDHSQLLDNKVHRALLTIQEIELVSRGYRLSTPLSPISRIEQSSKHKRCERLRSHLAGLLRRAFIVYEEAIIDMTDTVNKQTLSRLFDMHNIHSVASLSAAADGSFSNIGSSNNSADSDSNITLDYLKTLAHLMHSKRRECMLQFLALSVMTSDHDSIRKGYESGWRNINTILATLGKETKGFVKDIVDAMELEFYKPSMMDINNENSGISSSTNAHARQFIHRLSSLEQQLRTMEARIYLCNDELEKRQRLISKTNDNDSSEIYHQDWSLQKEYMALEKDIQQLVVEWETGRNALHDLMAPPPVTIIDSQTHTNETLPSPLPSPTMTPTDNTGHDDPSLVYIINSDESSDIFHLPLPSKASVYETTEDDTGDSNTTTIGSIKKSRAERIAEMKQKREQEAKEKASRMDPQTMVHELKNVLDRRALELDLSDDRT
ncbi:Mysoin-binding motif of peroxisomes-domain-containing protein [Halteromyces radiatus]|uniref:Mysoin-binding motif of peroxisomes-domain-containing protein n=1 Tax=Halteromyces radiatus TaxID=101107 RepID=UPI002220D85E|nr:Mysoin-binding motif of peroxisomes-domain-containing protein [Halteromyces radiatus]KAI8082837.1 Mysoin-binding motif of peroxisomes-domain-containing protein [Halteromyces radiatus]